jgi:hypothetical protein
MIQVPLRSLALFLLCFSLAERPVSAQCGMTTSIFFQSGCAPNWSVSTSGGTAPYNIKVYRQGMLYITIPNDADGSAGQWMPPPDGSGVGQMSVLVTDATGCTASNTVNSNVMVFIPQSVFSVTSDCANQQGTLRFNGQSIGFAICPIGAHPSIVDNVNTGTVSAGWTQESTYIWRYNTPLGPGSHTVSFANISYSCGGQYEECWNGAALAVNCSVSFNPVVFLQGPYSGGSLMDDGLRAAGSLPTTEPYTALGYNYVGTQTGNSVAPAVFAVTGNNAIVDWVVVELRQSSSPYAVVYSRPALLTRSGNVRGLDGTSAISCPVPPGSYRIAVRHRNHLGIMTSSAASLSGSATTVDMTAASSAYGTNARVLVGTRYCMWSGDGTGDGVISYTGAGNDRDPVLTAVGGTTPNNALSNVYDRRDINMDGVVRYTGSANDRDPILVNIGGTLPNNTIIQQLP